MLTCLLAILSSSQQSYFLVIQADAPKCIPGMMPSSLIRVALGAYDLLMSADTVSGNPGLKLSASPGYRNSDVCPQRCNIVGPNPANWSAYHNLEQFDACPLAVFQAFSIYDIDDASRPHWIYACSSYGPDFAKMPKSTVQASTVESINATYEVGWWDEGRDVAVADIRSAAKQLRQYLEGGHGSTNTRDLVRSIRPGRCWPVHGSRLAE